MENHFTNYQRTGNGLIDIEITESQSSVTEMIPFFHLNNYRLSLKCNLYEPLQVSICYINEITKMNLNGKNYGRRSNA